MKYTLNAELAALIEPHTGPVTEAVRTQRGFSSDYTVIIRGNAGDVFVKAVRADSRQASSIEREAAVNPFVRDVSPGLLWQARNDHWLALGFEYIPGTRHASFKPGSPDLEAAAHVLNRIGKIPLPDVALGWQETRYDRYADDGTAELFRGNALLHTDINPDNLLIGPSGDVTAVVDWAWPARGAAWMDAACMIVQLISAGHGAAEAEEWAGHCSAWTDADPSALDAFAVALVHMYRRFAEMDPAPWRTAMTEAAEAWAQRRGISA